VNKTNLIFHQLLEFESKTFTYILADAKMIDVALPANQACGLRI